MGIREAYPMRGEISRDAAARLSRLRGLGWLLDRAIGAGGKFRFGLDPILGLIPWIGDWIGAILSLYIVYESVRLGLPWRTIVRMLGNVAVEAIVGAVPLAGDVFDFLFQANMRNLKLIDDNYVPGLRGRPLRTIGLFLASVVLFLLGGMAVTLWLVIRLISSL